MGGSIHPCERVLVVNDNRDMLSSMRDVLEFAGAVVETAKGSAEALGILASGFSPSVIVLDLRLGEGERGQDFARLLRADPLYSRTPIALVSGDIGALKLVDPSVADATIGKPFDVDVLLKVLADLCRRSGPGGSSRP